VSARNNNNDDDDGGGDDNDDDVTNVVTSKLSLSRFCFESLLFDGCWVCSMMRGLLLGG